ncbi:MAG TPA: hypothetical protein VEA69_09635 [Tepidisphaeraceae bacterium]|nr:hypothetical protein [Tepidisphaeraceae bacterium]
MPLNVRSILIRGAIAAALLGAGACNETAPRANRPEAPAPVPPPLTDLPIGVQMTRREPRLAGVPFRVLLDFEKTVDEAFVLRPAWAGPMYPQPEPARRPARWYSGEAAPAMLEMGFAHTGKASLALRRDRAAVAVKLSSLEPEALAGKWTMAGAYFFSERPATVTVGLASQHAGGDAPLLERTVTLAAGQWTPVLLDLTTLAPAGSPSGSQANAPSLLSAGRAADLLVVRAKSAEPTVVFCDDVIVINNDVTWAEVAAEPSSTEPAAAGPARSSWVVRRRGFETVVDRPQRFRLSLKTPESGAAEGWVCREAGPMRARFLSTAGKTWTIYPDGRSVRDGQLDLLFKSADPALRQALAAQHESPGEMTVDEEMGRVFRESEGDRNNSGYDAARAAYQLASANRTRFVFSIAPRTKQIVQPVFEVSGLEKGAALIVVEGQLIERYAWLPDGRLIFELPRAVTRATTVNVSVK